jgi:hypothetical protein
MDVAAIGTDPRLGKPELSAIREVYKKKSQFTTQIIPLQFPISYSYGEEAVMDLYQEGDIINDAYVSFVYPSGKPSAVVDSFGTYILNWIQLEYGDQIIERINGEFLEMMNDITVPQGKQGALSNLTGKYLTSNLATYNVKLNFSIFKKGLPVCALKENPRVRISLRNFNEGCPTASAVNPVFKATLFVQYVFLPETERNFFIKNKLTYLFEQTQLFQTKTLSNCTIYTDFQNCTKELFVVLKGDSLSPYNWSEIISLRLLLNNAEIITHDIGTSLFLRYLQPLENHTRAPDRIFYTYSFALDPENDNPTGSVNLSGLKQQIDLIIKTTLDTYNINIYSRSYNILNIYNGYLRVIYPVPFLTYGDVNIKNSIPIIALRAPLLNVILVTYTSSVVYTLAQLTNPLNLPITWTYPTLAGITWSYTNYGITITAAQSTLLSPTSVTVIATYDKVSYSQTFTLTLWFGFVLQPIVGGYTSSGVTYDQMLTGVSGTNTTTGINYFDNRGTYSFPVGGAAAFQFYNLKIVASPGNLLTFIFNVLVMTIGSSWWTNIYIYYNSTDKWVLGAGGTFSSAASTTNVPITYTIPANTPPGFYSIAFVTSYYSPLYPGFYPPVPPDVWFEKKTVLEYVLQVV